MIKDVSLVTGLENPPQPGEWTYVDYRQLTADTETRYEIIAGVLYEMPPPSTTHQLVVTQLIIQLGNLVKSGALGVLYASPIDVILEQAATPVQPDLVFIQEDRRSIIKENRIEGPLDLVVEILSPSSVRNDRVAKFEVYEANGIQEYWILNPTTQSLEIYNLEDGLYNLYGEFRSDEPLDSPMLGELTFTIGSLFE